jgi:urease accessory protein
MRLILEKTCILKIVMLFLGIPTLLSAHPSLSHLSGLTDGLIHPFSGTDHLLAMLAIGIWASQIPDKAVWKLPATFIFVMLIGGLFGLTKIQIPFVEQIIITSVFVSGILIALVAKFNSNTAMLLVVVFAFFHGYAHGAEILVNTSWIEYVAGFLFSTLFLLSVGIFAGFYLGKKYFPILKYTGFAIIFIGITLFFVR